MFYGESIPADKLLERLPEVYCASASPYVTFVFIIYLLLSLERVYYSLFFYGKLENKNKSPCFQAEELKDVTPNSL